MIGGVERVEGTEKKQKTHSKGEVRGETRRIIVTRAFPPSFFCCSDMAFNNRHFKRLVSRHLSLLCSSNKSMCVCHMAFKKKKNTNSSSSLAALRACVCHVWPYKKKKGTNSRSSLAAAATRESRVAHLTRQRPRSSRSPVVKTVVQTVVNKDSSNGSSK